MVNFNLREHPLFKNRKRVLAVPVQATQQKATGRKILVNTAIAALVMVFFGAGFWMSHPGSVDSIVNSFGDGWNSWLSGLYGADLGSGLAEKTPWIMARAGGIMTYLAMFSGVVLGLFTSLRWVRGQSIMYLHRVVSLLGLVFLTIHLAGLAFDSYLRIGLAQSLIPFAVSYNPLWTALGVFAMYGVLVVGISAYLASKLGYKVWRSIHYLSFGLFWMSLLHGFLDGSDSAFPWMLAVYSITGAVVVFLTGFRVYKSRAGKKIASPVR